MNVFSLCKKTPNTALCQCPVNTTLDDPSLDLFPHIIKINPLRSNGYAQDFFFDLRKNPCDLTVTVALTGH